MNVRLYCVNESSCARVFVYAFAAAAAAAAFAVVLIGSDLLKYLHSFFPPLHSSSFRRHHITSSEPSSYTYI